MHRPQDGFSSHSIQVIFGFVKGLGYGTLEGSKRGLCACAHLRCLSLPLSPPEEQSKMVEEQHPGLSLPFSGGLLSRALCAWDIVVAAESAHNYNYNYSGAPPARS